MGRQKSVALRGGGATRGWCNTRGLQPSGVFDPWAYLGEKRLHRLKRLWAEVSRTHLLWRLPVGKLAKHFSSGMGRPTKGLHVCCGPWVLQPFHDLTDAAAVEALPFNIARHYARHSLASRNDPSSPTCTRPVTTMRGSHATWAGTAPRSDGSCDATSMHSASTTTTRPNAQRASPHLRLPTLQIGQPFRGEAIAVEPVRPPGPAATLVAATDQRPTRTRTSP